MCLGLVLLAVCLPLSFSWAGEPAREPRVDALGDPLPAGAVARLGTRRFQIGMPSQTLMMIRGGQAYVIFDGGYGLNGSLHWFDAATGRQLNTWKPNPGWSILGICPQREWALLFDRNDLKGKVRETEVPLQLFDLKRKANIKTVTLRLDRPDNPSSIRQAWFSTDAQWLATLSGSGTEYTGDVKLWHLATGKLAWTSAAPQKGAFQMLGFTPAVHELVVLSLARTAKSKSTSILVVDPVKGQIVRDVRSPDLPPNTRKMRLSPDGTIVYVQGGAAVELKTGKAPVPLKESTGILEFTPDGRTVLTQRGPYERSIEICDWPAGNVRQTIHLDHGNHLTREVAENILIPTNDTAYLTLSQRQTLYRLDLTTGKRALAYPETHEGHILGVAAAADGTIVSFGQDKTLRTWDAVRGRQTSITRLDALLPRGSFAFSPDGRYFASAEVFGKALFLYDRQTEQAQAPIPFPKESTFTGLKPQSFSPDGKLLALTSSDAKALRVWHWPAREFVADLPFGNPDKNARLGDLSFTGDGRFLLGSEGSKVHIWNVNRGKAVDAMPAPRGGLQVSPDGRLLAFVGSNEIVLMELASRQVWDRIPYQVPGTFRPEFSWDCRFLAYTTFDAKTGWNAEVWDIYARRKVGAFAGHEGSIPGLAFTRDGTRLVSASKDCTLLVWDLKTLTAKPAKPVPATAQDVRSAWDALSAEEGDKALAALGVLVNAPRAGLAFIKESLRPANGLEPAQFQKLVADLDNPVFAVRQQATKKLQDLGEMAEQPLLSYLAGEVPLEGQRRGRQILESLPIAGTARGPKQLRETRAVALLEYWGDSASRDLLRQLAGGAVEARLTQEAAGALRRLEGRKE